MIGLLPDNVGKLTLNDKRFGEQTIAT
jgi:hypothetical protein